MGARSLAREIETGVAAAAAVVVAVVASARLKPAKLETEPIPLARVGGESCRINSLRLASPSVLFLAPASYDTRSGCAEPPSSFSPRVLSLSLSLSLYYSLSFIFARKREREKYYFLFYSLILSPMLFLILYHPRF